MRDLHQDRPPPPEQQHDLAVQLERNRLAYRILPSSMLKRETS
jgi:hypothetical protein